MPEQLINAGWRAENDLTKFPFVEVATLVSDDGRILLEGTFVDAMLYPIGALAGVYLSGIEIGTSQATLSLGDPSTATIATGVFDLDQPPEIVRFFDLAGQPAGVLVTEPTRIASILSWGPGIHRLSRKASEFCPWVVTPCPETGLRSIRLDDGTVLSGDVWFVGDQGVVIRSEGGGRSGPCNMTDFRHGLRFDIVGDPLSTRILCADPEKFASPRPIKRIRFVSTAGEFEISPNEFGHVQIVSGDTLVHDPMFRIEGDPATLNLRMAAGLAGHNLPRAGG